MASYDAEVRVNTKINLNEFKKLNSEVDRLTKKTQALETRSARNSALGISDKSTSQRRIALEYDDAYKSLERAESELAKFKETHELEGLTSEQATAKLKAEQDALKNIGKTTEDTFKKVEKHSKKGTSALGKFGKRIRELFKQVFIFSLITKALRSVVSAVQDGLKNFAQFDKEYNKVMSDFKSQNATLKNALASAFAPIVETIIPMLTKLAEMLTFVADKIAQFFAVLSGKSVYAKAKKQVIDYAKGLKEASNNLASFDDINVLNQGGGNGELTGASAFETEEVETKVSEFAERVKGIMDELKTSLTSWWGEVDFTPLITSFERLKDACAPLVDDIGDGLLWLFENVLEPIGSFVIEDALPHFFDMLASAVDGCRKVLETLEPTLEFLWNELLVPIGNFIGEVFITVIDLAKQIIDELAQGIEENGDSINLVLTTLVKIVTIVWTNVKAVLQLALGIISGVITQIIKIIGRVIETLADVITFITAVFTGDFKQAFKSLVNILIDIVNLIIDLVEGGINAIIRGINNISFDVPDWIPGIGGKHMGFNLTEIAWKRIPKLATGGIVNRPTTAMVGEAGREAVIPLENNTEWMDMLAERIGSGNVTIKFDGSLSQLARVLNPVLDAEKSRIGTTLVIN